MKKEDISTLSQLIKSMEEASSKLEEAYEKKDVGKFHELKKFIIKIQREISGIVK